MANFTTGTLYNVCVYMCECLCVCTSNIISNIIILFSHHLWLDDFTYSYGSIIVMLAKDGKFIHH